MVYVRKLRWDIWNVAHIARHDVTPDEVQQVCKREPFASQTYRERLRLIGPTSAGRMLTIILEPEGAGVFYVITARPASRKERRRYEEVNG
ncbi:MAG TPA: BrnT family toxin [Dehalococcoidia bacterium]|nr:BrnT family toxin [Dehalococcoidia bacterium]